MKLTNLKTVLDAAGVSTVEVDGWQSRSRSTDGGEYKTGRPDHIMVHHTAGSTGADAASEVRYMVSTSSVAPVANLYISRTGEAWIMAAGATNCNGSGSAPWANGSVKTDDMNRHAIALELGCNGVGEPYSEAQQECLTLTVMALMNAYDIPLGHVRSHAEWSPGRKIDPAGPAKWQPSGGTWDMDNVRGYIWTRLGDDTAPDPSPPGPDADVIIAEPGDSAWSLMRKCGLDPAAIGAKGRDEWYALNYRVYPGVEVKRP